MRETYERAQTKECARAHLKGIWCAAPTPFRADLSLDEAGFRANLRHWFTELGVDGVFVAGKQGEFFSMSVAERKRCFSIAAEVARDCGRRTIMSCSDQNLDTVLELAAHAEECGADFIVVHAPVLHFLHERDETLVEYYRHISERTRLGIALWSHPDSGYLMNPDLCLRLAEIPSVVAIKYSVPREMYAELSRRAGDTLLVSTASEEEWLDNILELGWRLYLCSSPPALLQTAVDTRMREYTDLAFAARAAEARWVFDSRAPVQQAIRATKPGGKPPAHTKYWMELLGQAGGPVRRPMLNLTEAERAATRAAFASCGLKLTNRQAAE